MFLPEALAPLLDALWHARIEKRPTIPLTQMAREAGMTLTLEDAYALSTAIQKRLDDQLPGRRRIGRKIGLTSRAVQKQLCVDQPDFGFLSSEMLIPDGGTLGSGALLQGRFEGEVAFILKNDLPAPNGMPEALTPEIVLAATEALAPCIEIIDSRIADWKIAIEDTVADNASSSHFVLGSERHTPEKFGPALEGLRLMGMTLRKNDEVESTGVGAACLGNPLNAVTWLARDAARRGDPLRKGEIILSGAFGPVVPLAEGDQGEVCFNGLGRVSFIYGGGR